MELKTKYQYSYFIYPYIIDEKKYDKYILKLLRDENCRLKMFEKEKDLDIYTYFLPKVRDYLFWSFSYNKYKKRKLEELDRQMRSILISKYPCTMFEYTIGEDVQAKIGEENGIFFNIQKAEIICFRTGICFLLFKTIIEDGSTLSDVMDFNYKFRDINSEFISLKNYENIRLQTNSFRDIEELSSIIKNITGTNKEAKEMNLEEERFLTYSYACIDQENWREEEDFTNIEEAFVKFSNILPSSYQLNYNKNWMNSQTLQYLKFTKMGFTKQGGSLFTTDITTQNYTKLPFDYERTYLYTYILALYKKIYLKKINLELEKSKRFNKTREKFLEFTRDIWIQEITGNDYGSLVYEKWKETLELDYLYSEIKNKLDIEYKDLNIERTRRLNYGIVLILIAILGFNIINFIAEKLATKL